MVGWQWRREGMKVIWLMEEEEEKGVTNALNAHQRILSLHSQWGESPAGVTGAEGARPGEILFLHVVVCEKRGKKG